MQNRVLSAVAAVAVAATLASCAYYLIPERRGKHSDVAVEPLFGDILWLIPGIIPGVICLVVDFTSGAIYKYPYGYHEYIGARPAAPPTATAQSTSSGQASHSPTR